MSFKSGIKSRERVAV